MRDRNWTLPGARWLAASLSIALLVAAPASAQITSTCPRSADYVLVTDVGFSTYAVLDDMKAAENYLLDLLEWTNRAGAVSYETTATLDHGLTWVFDPVRAAIDGYAEGGYPDLAAGIRTAQEHLEATGAPNPVMVILQHGMPTHGGLHSHEGMAYAQLEAANAHRAGTQVFAIALSNYPVVQDVLRRRIALTPSHYYDGTVLPLNVIMDAIQGRVCLCGDGVVDALEQCDDGNTVIGDGCRACAVDSVCGDGFISVGESCDDGMHCFGGILECTMDSECAGLGDGMCLPRGGAGQCPEDCILDPPNCGDGVSQVGEQCDDGNTDPDDGCDGCLMECDDTDAFDIETAGTVTHGPVSGTDYCDSTGLLHEFTCLPCFTQWGAPILAPQLLVRCEDLGYVGCLDGACFPASHDPDPPFVAVCTGRWGHLCGDGILDHGELCDDGNTTDGDGCDSLCAIEEACGDGIVTEGEECDDGNQDDGDGCSNDCMLECGDGVLDPDEECDDGNREDGDGCSRFCLLESTCGDGVLDPDEQCDDGNTDEGDG